MFKNDETVWIPGVHTVVSTKRVLVLDWVDGIKVNDYEALDAAGIDRTEVAKRLLGAYLEQFFRHGFYHADPHPGNVFVAPGPQIWLIDFGMVASLDDGMQRSLKTLFLAYLQRDARALVGALRALGFIGRGADMESIQRAVALMLERYYGMTARQARELDVGDVASDIEDLLYGQPFQVPTRFAYTGRAIGTLAGVTSGLASNFNFVKSATPYAREFLGLSDEEPWRQVLDQIVALGPLLLRMPHLLERVANRLDTGAIRVTPVETRRGRRAARAARGSSVLLPAVQVAGGVTLLALHQPIPGWFCLALAAIATLRSP